MADLTLSCPHCSRNITVSEFADRETLRCPGCGASGLLPQTGPEPDAQPPFPASRNKGLRLKAREPSPEELAPPVAEVPEELIRKRMLEGLSAQAWRDFLPLAYWLIVFGFLILSGFLLRARVPAIARWLLGGG